jgi:hypothetical protein
MKVAIGLVILSAMFLTGCAPIQSQSIIRQELGSPLIASAGSVIFRLDKTSDLPNAFGKADIYGGKVDRGFTEVRIVSIDSATSFTLMISDVEKTSTETVFDRYQPYMTDKAAVSVTTNVNLASQQTSVPANRLSIDFSKVKMFAVSGYVIRFVDFDGVNLIYKVEKQR